MSISNDFQEAEVDATGQAPVWRHRTLWLIGLLLAWRIVYAAIVPLDLIHDEAYYWDWSRQLDLGYYSKPPMIAWIIALATRIGGDTPWVIRLPAVLLGTGGLLVIYQIASRLYDRRTGFWAVAATAATPGNTVASLLMTIDAPFLFCWSVALYSFWRMLQRQQDRVVWAVATAVAIGLGLLSKQTTFGFLALGGLFVLTSPEDRRELFRPALWLTALAAILMLAPVAWWNSQHDWITIQHTGEHFQAAERTPLRRLAQLGDYLGGQAGVVSPVICLLLALVAFGGLFVYRRLARRERYLVCFSAVPLAGVLGLSLLRRIEPNWPAAFYVAGIVLLAGWATGHVDIAPWLDRWRRWFAPGVLLGAGLCVATCALPFVLPWTPLHGSNLDPTCRLRGWRQLAKQVDRQRARLPDPDRALVISATGRAVASELAFYMRPHPRAYVFNSTGVVASQYDVWGGPADSHGQDAIVLTQDDRVPAPLAAAFERIERMGHVAVPLGSGRELAYHVWRGVRLKAWPAGEEP